MREFTKKRKRVPSPEKGSGFYLYLQSSMDDGVEGSVPVAQRALEEIPVIGYFLKEGNLPVREWLYPEETEASIRGDVPSHRVLIQTSEALWWFDAREPFVYKIKEKRVTPVSWAEYAQESLYGIGAWPPERVVINPTLSFMKPILEGIQEESHGNH